PLDLALPYTGCNFSIDQLTTNNSGGFNISSYGDDRGGIAVTPQHVFVVQDNYTVRMDKSTNGLTSLPIRDGIFSDLNTGQLYSLWSTSYNDFVYWDINAI